jgi:hypothetical protein
VSFLELERQLKQREHGMRLFRKPPILDLSEFRAMAVNCGPYPPPRTYLAFHTPFPYIYSHSTSPPPPPPLFMMYRTERPNACLQA